MIPARPATDVDRVANHYADELAKLSPMAATFAGIEGQDSRLDDLSPEGHTSRNDLARATLNAIDTARPEDETDRITVAAMRERLGVEMDRFDAGEHLRDLNNVASPVQDVRGVFDLMPHGTPDQWAIVAARLAAVPAALASYRVSLLEGARQGIAPAVRQVRLGIAQSEKLAAQGSFFDELVGGAEGVSDALANDLSTGSAQARAAYGELAAFLADRIAPSAPAADGVGKDRYRLASRYFLGAAIDLEETYAWGIEELARVVSEQSAVAAAIGGEGTSVADAVKALDADPTFLLSGTDALQTWMTGTSAAAIEALSGTHFDIPDPVRRLECLIAPTHDGGIYYTGPSQDFARPGRMWWSVPDGVTEFGTWRERTTVYHEGVPGHHMQIGLTTYYASELNSWRRALCWVSGHGEGWALYAERLMDTLGFLPTPADRLGMLDGQRLRAARVVFDIGVHLGLPAPEEWGAGRWDADKGWRFLQQNVAMNPGFVRFEYERYLGWPGQAPAYKVGERLWLRLRDEAQAAAERAGETFDLKAFHMRALRLGALGLDVLRDALAGAYAL
ncbi:MAG: DUF885 domain-containing protein [Bifidobacteriaceae bacterium]|jgi:uncharacterized protein (DUF885 family)|nr:DUF885 domain-containing protein [Bifidobacteriaceae bacterium]